ncbi:hypothetical protein B0J12DRAFT_717839 [Macrophomina phaseolina]|uniref:NACHT domain-containing protein n=1 Tax=Macrophomina phaseolina TaxID=35725 RepID=A0ABQ8GGR8_9PEZI|nr:hypothetical protein B0J12DRAFT_717839 [Macrophomina phaseolina]
MDPASAIGLAAGIVQLTSFAGDLLSKAREIRNSADGALVENQELEAIATGLQQLSQGLSAGNRYLTRAEKQLTEMCNGCQDAAKDLLGVRKKHTLTERLERYRRQIDSVLLITLRKSVERLGPKCMLYGAAEHHRDYLHQLRILENLRFYDKADRFERIPEAHKKTFEWIFSDDCSSDRNPFWITGKPGAGKSTLMKYLYNDRRSFMCLAPWTGSGRFVVASFFFWNSGTVVQMSRFDLPDAIPNHFLDRWNYYQNFSSDLHQWTWPEIASAFESLASVNPNEFFFVVDGLDGFNGDCAELASWIIRTPWLMFEDAFKSSPFFRVEKLTAPDIWLFTTEKLQASQAFADLQKSDPQVVEALISEVIEKASGVFLWVRLVVMSLLDGLRDEDSSADLQNRLRELPPDLEDLFRKILETLKPPHLIILAAEEPLSLRTLSFAQHTIQEAMAFPIELMDTPKIVSRTRIARRRLVGRREGLLEAPTFTDAEPDAIVQFSHRKVRDFVRREDMQTFLRVLNKDFDPFQAICISYMLRLKSVDVEHIGDLRQFFKRVAGQYFARFHVLAYRIMWASQTAFAV